MLKTIAKQHFEWIKEMNWTGSPILSMLSLIGSEIGESSNECRKATPTDDFKYEIADIVLRIIALMEEYTIDIKEVDIDKNKEKNNKKFDNLNELESMSLLYIQLGKAIEKQIAGKSPWKKLNKIIDECYFIANKSGFDIEKIMQEKIKKNKERGSKGRTV